MSSAGQVKGKVVSDLN